MPQTIVGIDIGTYSIKIAQLKRTFKSFELIKFYERAVQYNDVLTPEESVSSALTTLIEDNALSCDHAIVAVPGQYVSSRTVNLPITSKKKIDQVIEFELENYIPFNLEDVVADYHIVKSMKESSKLLVLYAPKIQFAKFLSMLNAAGVDPRHVCIEGVELINLVNLGMSPPEGLFSIIDIGHKKTTVTICKGKSLVYTRVISVGGWHITDSIAKKMNVPFNEAEKLKIEMGQISLDEPQGLDDVSKRVFHAIKIIADELVLQLKQTFFAYQDEEGEVVSGLYLSGGTSRLVGLDNYISMKLKQNVAFLDCLEFHFSRLSASEVHLQLIPQALALALKGVAPAGLPDVNFRSGEFAYKGDVEKLGGGLRRAAMAASLVILLAIAYFSIKYYSLSRALSAVNKEVAALVSQSIPEISAKRITNTSSALQAVKGRKSEISEKLSKLNSAMSVSALEVLKNVSANVPERGETVIDVDDLNFTGDYVKIAGRTTSFEAVDKIKQALEKSRLFKEVATGNVRKGVKDDIKFDLTITMLSPAGK